MTRRAAVVSNPPAGQVASDTGVILLVDDEPAIQRFLRPALSVVGYDVLVASSGTEALTIAATRSPDLILLDLGLPDIDGLDVLVCLRKFYKGPIVVISGRSRDLDTISALDAGADDYVEKPFSLGKLIARIRRVLHAGKSAAANADIGSQPLKFQHRRALLRGQDLNLTRKQYDLLFILARNQNRIMPADEILGAVWGQDHTQKVNYLRVHISLLRKSLVGVEPPLNIETVPSLGYRLTIGKPRGNPAG
jgi:two-component system, OmpR family, KDP operon response regulator KdpE